MIWNEGEITITDQKKNQKQKKVFGEDGGGNSPSYLKLSWSHKYFL